MLVFFILIILIIYNIQKNSLNSPPGKGTLYTDIEHFNDTYFSSESIKNVAKVYADTSSTVAFNNVKITGNLDVSGVFNAFNFKGVILAWSGSINSIPPGWALCDGSGGNPDLRGRFILGHNTGSSYNGDVDSSGNIRIRNSTDISGAKVGNNLAGVIGSIGGEVMHTLTVKEMPAHNHKLSINPTPACTLNLDSPTFTGVTPGCPHSASGRIQSYRKDIWGIDIVNIEGNDVPHNNLPPFYVLAFIIKL